MYKIMFIDDDSLILRRLHQILDWEALGFEVLPDALNGVSALEQIHQTLPDVVICDINMPYMDGLEFSARVKSSFPTVRCILLTVNDSFGCAQEAINIGVDYYLLKPIDPFKLKSLLEKILQDLNSSREKEAYISSLYTRASLTDQMIREKFLNWFVSGQQPLDEKQIQEKFRFYHIPLEAQEFQIISVHVDTLNIRSSDEPALQDLTKTALKTLEDTLSNYSNCVVFADSFYHFNVIIGFQEGCADMEPNAEFLCQLIQDNFLFDLNLPVIVLYSRKYSGASNIYRCYYDTKLLAQYPSTVQNRGILSCEEYLHNSVVSSVDLDTLRLTTLKQLRLRNYKALEEHLISTLTPPFSHKNFDTFNMLRIDFVMTGIMFLHENKISIRDIFSKEFLPLSEIMNQNELKSCIDFLKTYYFEILNYLEQNKVSSARHIAERCIELIEQNISSCELSVEWLSRQLYISKDYLSKLFRQEMKITLIKYITNRKMERAKEYLTQGYHNLQQVSAMLGFSDPLYFSKCFKKQFGISPSQYIQALR